MEEVSLLLVEVMEDEEVKTERLLFSHTLTSSRLLRIVGPGREACILVKLARLIICFNADHQAAGVNHIHQFTELDLQQPLHQDQWLLHHQNHHLMCQEESHQDLVL